MLLRRILPVFLLVPLVEIIILIKVGEVIGVFWTVLLVILTAIAGGTLAKIQGLMVLQQINQSLSYGEMPGNHVLDGALIFVGGLLLLTPGFVSDITGFVLLLPWTRVYFRELIKKWLKSKLVDGNNIRTFYW